MGGRGVSTDDLEIPDLISRIRCSAFWSVDGNRSLVWKREFGTPKSVVVRAKVRKMLKASTKDGGGQ